MVCACVRVLCVRVRARVRVHEGSEHRAAARRAAGADADAALRVRELQLSAQRPRRRARRVLAHAALVGRAGLVGWPLACRLCLPRCIGAPLLLRLRALPPGSPGARLALQLRGGSWGRGVGADRYARPTKLGITRYRHQLIRSRAWGPHTEQKVLLFRCWCVDPQDIYISHCIQDTGITAYRFR